MSMAGGFANGNGNGNGNGLPDVVAVEGEHRFQLPPPDADVQ